MGYDDWGERRIECCENEKEEEMGIFINWMDISGLYFLRG